MNAFHGYGHNRLCQLGEHPLYIDGFGLEDLETCERVFSSSNHVASLVRHASHFHYSQFLDLFFQSWDEDKYAALSTFLYNNMIQAQDLIDSLEPIVSEYKRLHNLTTSTIEGWRLEEKAFLETLKAEPTAEVLAMDYVEALQELQQTEAASNLSRVELEAGIVMFTPEDLQNASQADIVKANTKKRKAHADHKAAINNVASLERLLHVEVRWSPESDAYKAALDNILQRTYNRALDRLQYLMLQRLLELSKTHAVGTGYKMREAIGKNIKARSKAIGTAVKNYNDAALALEPPAPPVDFAKLMDWTELQEFDLLRVSRRGDVRDREWAQPTNRAIAVKHYKVKRAYEEQQRCLVEIRRLVTAIRDEDADLTRRHAELVRTDHALAYEVGILRRRRAAVNAQHIHRLTSLAQEPGMSAVRASLVPGVREGTATPPAPAASSASTPSTSDSTAAAAPLATRNEDLEAEESGDDLDDEQAEQVGAMQDFFGQL
ncbi:hypothetical protein EXIGLDRAFT_735062, partial [Exidia glandulosa HHB12029]